MNHRSQMMAGIARTPGTRIAALLFAATLAATPRAAAGQDAALAFGADVGAAAGVLERGAGGAAVRNTGAGTALARGRYAVVIDLDQNKLFFKQGDVTLWSATVGTGTGVRLKADDGEWKFS